MKQRFARQKIKAATSFLLTVVLLFSIGTVSSSTRVSADPVVSTDWMVNGGYGVSLHWTSQSVPSGGGSPAAFCTAVNNFNVTTFANQLADAGASFYMDPWAQITGKPTFISIVSLIRQ